MPGVSIGDGVVVGADSMINKDVPANCLVAGSPAKIIKENFPTLLSVEEKKKVLASIFAEFTQYLNHHEFTTEQKTIPNGFELSIKNKSTHAAIIFCETDAAIPSNKIANSILVLNKGVASPTTNYAMTISIEHNTRLGTSAIGEELVQFFSRYGVRFNRLD
ncbi:MAG: hypothetical protein ACHQII_08035 [Bacteroidia bacterium]